MKIRRFVLLFGAGLSLAACATGEGPTRNTPFEQLPTGEVATPAGYESTAPQPLVSRVVPGASVVKPGAVGNIRVNRITVNVPRSLTVSEANRYLPKGDIVWRGDPIGDRYAQVQAIFENGFQRGAASLNGSVPVDLDVEVVKFHSLTEKARYVTGGVHAITFNLAIRDPKTGELLVPARQIRADLEGFGGAKAIKADSEGQTMKVRITGHLAYVIHKELSDPNGYKNASLGLIQKLNQF